MKKTTLRKYAKLIAKVGANVRKGQPVQITASPESHEFVEMVAAECYRLGAKYVNVEWRYQPLTKLAFRWQSVKTLSTLPEWQKEKQKFI